MYNFEFRSYNLSLIYKFVTSKSNKIRIKKLQLGTYKIQITTIAISNTNCIIIQKCNYTN